MPQSFGDPAEIEALAIVEEGGDLAAQRVHGLAEVVDVDLELQNLLGEDVELWRERVSMCRVGKQRYLHH